MAIVEGLIKPWAKHQSKKSAAQVLKQSVKGADLAKEQAVKNHLSKINGKLNGNGNGNGNGLRNGVKANQSTFVPEPEAVVLETNKEAVEVATDQHLKKQQLRGVISVEQPLIDFEKSLTKSLQDAGYTGDINLSYPKRQSGPLGDKQTPYRNYAQLWYNETDRPLKESLYAAKDGDRYFSNVADKSTGRLSIRNLNQKLDEVIGQNDWRGIAIAEQTADPVDLKTWNQTLKTERGWEAHHLNMIKLISNIVNGMNLEGRKAVYRHLGRRYNLWTGNSVYNKVNLPPDIHDWVHAEMDRIGINYRKIKFDENTSIKKRIKYIKNYAKKMDEIQRFIYKKMSERASVASKLN